MKYWIIIDGVQKGPLSIEELSVTPGLVMSTPVWHEGLADWTTASAVPELSAVIAALTAARNRQQGAPYGTQQQYGGYQQPYANMNPYGQPQPFGQAPISPDRMPPMPNTYLAWAIISTICCCLLTGVVAIIYSSQVSPAYMRGDYAGAVNASSKAQLWVIISFVAGLIWAPFSVLLSLL